MSHLHELVASSSVQDHNHASMTERSQELVARKWTGRRRRAVVMVVGSRKLLQWHYPSVMQGRVVEGARAAVRRCVSVREEGARRSSWLTSPVSWRT
jgi:hypothetical protein